MSACLLVRNIILSSISSLLKQFFLSEEPTVEQSHDGHFIGSEKIAQEMATYAISFIWMKMNLTNLFQMQMQ